MSIFTDCEWMDSQSDGIVQTQVLHDPCVCTIILHDPWVCTMITAKIVSMIRKYHNHKLQTTPWHCEEELPNHHETPGRQIKQSNQLSLFPIKMIAILEWT